MWHPPPFCYDFCDIFQFDGTHEDCRTQKIIKKHSLNEAHHRNGVLTHCFRWRCRYFYHHSIVITSSYRCQVSFIQVDDTMLWLSAMGLVRIKKFNRDGKKGLSPPPPSPCIPSHLLCINSWLSRRISFEILLDFVYAFSDWKVIGV